MGGKNEEIRGQITDFHDRNAQNQSKVEFYLTILKKIHRWLRSNQSILKEINPEYSLEGLMLKLKLLYFGHLMQKTDSSEKPLMLGKIEGGRSRLFTSGGQSIGASVSASVLPRNIQG